MKSIVRLVVVVAVAVGAAWWLQRGGEAVPAPGAVGAPALAAAPAGAPATPPGTSAGRLPVSPGSTLDSGDAARRAFAARVSDRQLLASGSVRRILADDRDGSRHQRFIIGTDSGLSLLIAHNIDVAPRLEGLAVGEGVVVFGEYEWNDQGGVMHWTHADPQGRHVPGYIEWRGRRYQ